MIYRVFNDETNEYEKGLFVDEDMKLFKLIGDIKIEMDRGNYSIEWGIEIEGKKFFENDVFYASINGWQNKLHIFKKEFLCKHCYTIEDINIVGTIHDDKFKHLKEL